MKKLRPTLLMLTIFLMLSCSGSSSPSGEESVQPEIYGDFSASIKVDDLTRTFLYHIPKNRQKPSPLIIALHGGGGSGKDMIKLTKGEFNTLSEKYGFIVAYPDAVEKHWNDGRELEQYYSNRENIDDVKFISKLIDYFVSNFSADGQKVLVTGMSNGGLMAFRLACQLSEKIKAIAPVAASMSVNIHSLCSPQNQISVLIIHGTEDPLIPFEGGTITFNGENLGEVIGAENTATYFSNLNFCNTVSEKTYLEDKDPQDGTRAWKTEYTNCANGTKIALIGIDGGGHTWPDGDPYLPESIIGKVCKDFNACETITSFFLNED